MSAKKRTSLESVFGIPELVSQPPEGALSVSPREGQTQSKRPGVKQQTAYLPKPVYEQLRKLGFEERRKLHSYLMEGLDRVFAERGLRSIKDLTQ